ncbi:MAG: RHS repeat protein, partial [Acidobacteria bacterium]|nr:RHS repeat protein [Acidobacteriota bacterium]
MSGQLLNCTLTQLDNGMISGAWYSYGPGGQITDKKEYDYGLINSGPCTYSAPANPTRETVTAYQSFLPTPIFPSFASIFDRPSSTKTYKNGTSGTLMAETDYLYDGTAVGSVSSLTGHDDVNYGSGYNNRGNLTTKTVKCIGCTDAVAKYTYDVTGQVLSMTDPCGNGTCSDMTGASHTTNYYYADSYSSGTPPGNTNAYLTKITDPLGHSTSFAYAYSDGQLTSSKDANNQTTNYIYNTPPSGCSFPDGLDRLSEIDYPDIGKTMFCYNDAAPSPSVTTTKLINSSTTLATIATTDGFGHVVKTQLTSDPDGTDITDTTYDGLGRVWTKSNPHRSSSLPTDGITTYSYDVLGRGTSVLEPDGSVTSTAYSGNCQTVTDEAYKIRKSCSDGLGRLIEVDEPGTGAGIATSGTGTITVSGSEQSTTVSARAGSGTVTISGSEQTTIYYPCGTSSCPTTLYDTGSVSIIVNGFTATTSYYQGATASSVASSLLSGLNSGSSPVTATLSGTVITMTAKTTGASTNYSLSATSSTNYPSYFFDPSFWGTPSGSTLTGGQDAGTLYDTGTVSVTVNGFTASASYSQTANNTPSLIASSLASALNGSGSPVVASVNGSVITLTATQVGSSSNYALSTTKTWNTQSFTNPSFIASPSGTTLTGGTDSSLGSSPLVTLYRYDALNNLTCAVQKGTDTTAFSTCASASSTWRPRSFVYDSLSRLTIATNPESGTISYTYDANGNVANKTAPTPNKIPADTSSPQTVTSTYFYDADNRLTKKQYSDGTTPTVQFGYDGVNPTGCSPPTITSPTNLVGQRTGMCDAAGSASWSYDSMGRALTEKRLLNSTVTNTVGYTYNFDGSLKTLTYPSGRTVTYTPGGAGGPLEAKDTANSINYVKSATYAPPGNLTGMTNGLTGSFNGIITTNTYNSRLQPITLSAATTGSGGQTVLSLGYDFHLGSDNGNVFQIVNNRDNNRTQNFTYDALNRIGSAYTTGSNWGETFTIDPWGNLTNRGPVTGKTSYEALNAPAASNNQISGFCYDIAGNMLGTGGCPSLPYNPVYVYDAENRLRSINQTVTPWYTYDGDGKRVVKGFPAVNRLYWTGVGS